MMADYQSIHSIEHIHRTKWQQLLYHIRYLRLHLILQSTRWRQENEVRKVALCQNRLAVFVHVLGLGLPIAIAIALLFVNIHGFYLGDISATTLTGIQFAAKFSELFVQASMANIALALIRLRLLHGELPLGGLVAPYRMNDVSYLWSLEFWGLCTSRGALKSRNLCLETLLAILIVLTALAGPSIAVLMLPRLMTSEFGRALVLTDLSTSTLTQMVEQSSWNLTSE